MSLTALHHTTTGKPTAAAPTATPTHHQYPCPRTVPGSKVRGGATAANFRLSSRNTLSSTTTTKRKSTTTTIASSVNGRDPSQRIVITGLGVVSVFGNDPDTFYESLLEGQSGVKPITRFDASGFPTTFAAQIEGFDTEGLIDTKNLRRYDDCIKYGLVAGKKALKSSGLEIGSDAFEKLDKSKSGVLIGTGMGGLTVFSDAVTALANKGPRRMSPFFIPYAITNMTGALLGIETGFTGPNYSISTACATANYAFVSAATHIKKGDANLIVAGGSEAPIIPIGLGGFVACRALSSRNEEPEKASRPWDKDRDGFVLGEGCGVVIMESLEHAEKRGAKIICEYLGGQTNCDAHHMTEPKPDGSGVSSCIEDAIRDAQIDRDMVNYINAHATSTPVGILSIIKYLIFFF